MTQKRNNKPGDHNHDDQQNIIYIPSGRKTGPRFIPVSASWRSYQGYQSLLSNGFLSKIVPIAGHEGVAWTIPSAKSDSVYYQLTLDPCTGDMRCSCPCGEFSGAAVCKHLLLLSHKLGFISLTDELEEPSNQSELEDE